MRLFRSRMGRYTATFSPAEARLLADLVDQIRTLLSGRRTELPADPLVEVTGMSVGASSPPEDPALARLLPDFHAEDPEISSALRMLREPELIAAKDAAAVAMLDSLPPGGGTVRLDEETAQSWLTALNDLRLALGTRLEISDDEVEPPAASADPTSPAHAMYLIYRWLSTVQESLVGALTGER